jgi:hypothetical protein
LYFWLTKQLERKSNLIVRNNLLEFYQDQAIKDTPIFDGNVYEKSPNLVLALVNYIVCTLYYVCEYYKRLSYSFLLLFQKNKKSNFIKLNTNGPALPKSTDIYKRSRTTSTCGFLAQQ